MQVDVGEDGTDYAPNDVAKNVLEFSIDISREQLRPKYGDGFRGAPLDTSRSNQHPPERNRGEKRDAATDKEVGGETNV